MGERAPEDTASKLWGQLFGRMTDAIVSTTEAVEQLAANPNADLPEQPIYRFDFGGYGVVTVDHATIEANGGYDFDLN